MHEMSPCQQKEADTHTWCFICTMQLIMNALKPTFQLRIADTDVVILSSVGSRSWGFPSYGLGLAQEKHSEITSTISPSSSWSLTSAKHLPSSMDPLVVMLNLPYGIGKNSAWNAWVSYPEASKAAYNL